MPLLAVSLLVTAVLVRVHHVRAVTAVGESGPVPGLARLIVPDHNNASFAWLDLTRVMVEQHELRVRHIDYENAPFGRDVFAPSPYRWWLGTLVGIRRAVSGDDAAAALDWAATWSDPILQLIAFAGLVVFVARRFGSFSAALASLGAACLFPLNTEFLPAMPDDRGIAFVLSLWAILLTLDVAGSAGILTPASLRRRMVMAGVVGAIGLWLNVPLVAPILAGIALGGVVATLARRSAENAVVLPWRAWGLAGAITAFAAYLIEFFPGHLGEWQLRSIHPLYAVAWLAGGEAVARIADGLATRKWVRSWRDPLIWVLILAGLAAIPVAMRLTHQAGIFAGELSDQRLARIPDGPAATNLVNWMYRDGLSAMFSATLLPLLLLVPILWMLFRRVGPVEARARLGLSIGPVVVALGFAGWKLSWWSGVDTALLAALVATGAAVATFSRGPVARWAWGIFVGGITLPGAVLFSPRHVDATGRNLNEGEVYGLVERDLARWLARRSGVPGEIALAPHNLTFTLHHYGNLRGLATLGLENLGGLEIAMRIVSASTPEEARELIDRRGVRYLVIPSWDSYLDFYARLGLGKMDETFLNRLHFWRLPPWLRPVAYSFPGIAGFEGQYVTILQVVEDQDDAVALSRLAEYFVDMGQLNQAGAAAQTLRRYPADLGALVARAQVELAREDTDNFARTAEQVRTRVAGGGDKTMPWDRRVSLAVVLYRAKQNALSADQVRRCLTEMDEAGLRNLPTGLLYRLQVLAKAFGQPISDPKLRSIALDLLPDEMRERVQ